MPKNKKQGAQIQSNPIPLKLEEFPKVEKKDEPKIVVNTNVIPKKEDKVLSAEEIKSLPNNDEEKDDVDDSKQENNELEEIPHCENVKTIQSNFSEYHLLPLYLDIEVSFETAMTCFRRSILWNDLLLILKENVDKSVQTIYDFHSDNYDSDKDFYNNNLHSDLLINPSNILKMNGAKIHVIYGTKPVNRHAIFTELPSHQIKIEVYQLPFEYYEEKRKNCKEYHKQILDVKLTGTILKNAVSVVDEDTVFRMYYFYSDLAILPKMEEIYHSCNYTIENTKKINSIAKRPKAYLKNMKINDSIELVLKNNNKFEKTIIRRYNETHYIVETFLVDK
jgi:hypothetical protein